MFVLFVLGLFLACLIVVPLLLVGLALRLAIAVVLLPFRIAGLAAGLAVGFVGLLFAGAILLIPLLPVIALVGGIWLMVRLARRQPAAQLATD